MSDCYCELFNSSHIKLIKIRCRKLGVRADQVDDCLQDIALKILLSNRSKAAVNCRAIDNHITSQIRKEVRYKELLNELTENFREAIVYQMHLKVDIQSVMSSLSIVQQQICKLISIGFTHKEISQKLQISLRTIGREVAAIRRLLTEYDL